MNFSFLDNMLWAAGFAANAALLLVLIWKERWREFAVFVVWIAFQVVLTFALFSIYRYGSAGLYEKVYWSGAVLDFALQIGVVFEMARIVLRPTGTWLQDARSRFLFFGLLGALLAACVAFVTRPSAYGSLDAWEIRGNLFTSMCICELFLVMMMSANRLGLHWNNHVMGLGRGLTAWAVISFCVDALQGLLGRAPLFKPLDQLRDVAWLGAAIYWSVIFWKPQAERLPLSPAMQKYLFDLHARVRYDLDKVQSSTNR
jgi:hypothetical protein